MQKRIAITKEPTPAQVEMLRKAAAMPLPADAEYPEFSEEELREFKKISNQRRTERQKPMVSLRISTQALDKARSLGSGYTAVLSRILEYTLNDPDTLRQFL